MTHFLRMIMKNGNLGGDKCQLMEHERTPMMVRLCVCVCHYLLFRYQQGDQLGTIGCSLPMFRVSRDPSWSLLVLIMEHQQEGMIYQILPIRAYNHQYSPVRQPEKTKEDLRIGRQNAVSICGCVCIVLYDVHVMGYSKPNTISWLV